jgi:peptidoglycan/xylan/chitin deacetylase (PgdA/CDA1 family)
MFVKSVFNFAYRVLFYCGATNLFRWIFARTNITVVTYHNPEAEIFRTHMNYLSQRYNFISLSDIIDVFYSYRPSTLPKYSLLVTFDDGWKENFQLLNIFREYRLRPVIFLSTHLVDTFRNFWFTICPVEKVEALKEKQSDDRLKYLKETYDYFPEKEFPVNRQVLNIEEIFQMADYVDFGSHTAYHTILTKCSAEEKEKEIKGSFYRLEQLLNTKVTSFAYPNGDYDDTIIDILKKNGIKVARSIDAGLNKRNSDPFRLKVTGVSDNASIPKLASELTGISRYIQYLKNGSFLGLKPKV